MPSGRHKASCNHREPFPKNPHREEYTINNWRIANGCAPIAETEVRRAVAATADIVEEKIGFTFEKNSVITREKRSHFVGDSVAADGETYFRMIAPRALTKMTRDFISRFAVDPETGKSYKIEA